MRPTLDENYSETANLLSRRALPCAPDGSNIKVVQGSTSGLRASGSHSTTSTSRRFQMTDDPQQANVGTGTRPAAASDAGAREASELVARLRHEINNPLTGL